MLSSRFKPWHVPLFLGKYAWLRLRRRPLLVHFEVTLRCNARCGFCDYWKTDASERDRELKSYADAARYFNPMLVTFTGGEPTLRSDLESLVRAVSDAVRLKYVTLITHGAMLSPDRAWSLWEAGINQFNISLDYLDGRHDDARGIPGLTEKIFRTVPAMRERGIDNIRFNTVIKDDNLDQILPIVERAAAMDCGVNLSVYTDAKNGNREHLLRAGAAGRGGCAGGGAARLQAAAPRRHHELRLLPGADSALRARRDDGAVPERHQHDPRGPGRLRAALPRLSHRLPLARLRAVPADELQRLLLRLPR